MICIRSLSRSFSFSLSCLIERSLSRRHLRCVNIGTYTWFTRTVCVQRHECVYALHSRVCCLPSIASPCTGSFSSSPFRSVPRCMCIRSIYECVRIALPTITRTSTLCAAEISFLARCLHIRFFAGLPVHYVSAYIQNKVPHSHQQHVVYRLHVSVPAVADGLGFEQSVFFPLLAYFLRSLLSLRL